MTRRESRMVRWDGETLWVLAVLGLSGATPPAAPAQDGFATPRLVTDGSGQATQTATGIDLANNAYVSSVIDERIQLKIIGPDVNVDVSIDSGAGLGQGDPDFATDIRGTTYMVFSQLDEAEPGSGRELYLTHNTGGQGFVPPVRLTRNRVDDYAPRIALDADGDPHVAWAQNVGAETRVMSLRWREGEPIEEPQPVASGDFPHLFVDDGGTVHVVYSRANDVFYNASSTPAWKNEKRVTTTPTEPESAASIGGDQGGNILVSYESRNALYFSTKPQGGSFRAPKLLDTGGILDPKMRVRSRGQVTIVYAKKGDIYYIVGLSSILEQPRRITNTPEVEGHPSIEIDLSGNIHVSFIRDGEVYYTNNAAAPVAEFAGLPTQGEVPLKVSFEDLSSGDAQVWEWDFGDGGTSTERSPVHVYETPGRYTVKLRIVSPGANESVKEKRDYITVQDPFNTLEIPDQWVIPGQKEVWFPVLAGHKEPIKAYQLMGTFDPNLLHLSRFELAHTVVEALQPEQLCFNDRGTYFEVCCVFEFFPPIDPRKEYLQPGQNQTILNIVFDVSEDAPQGAQTRIDLVNDRAITDIFNIFTINNFTRLPALEGSTVEVLSGPPFPRFFTRGDADGNAEVDITDAIRILNYLFTGGDPPVCFDAADVNDRGTVDISGPISLLSYLFLGGVSPAVPFPGQGPDPTEDELPDC